MSFTIKCNKCGSEVEIDETTNGKETTVINLWATYDHDVLIECKCGNEIKI